MVTSNRVWRWIALTSWALIVLAYLAFFLTDLWLDFAQLQIVCVGPDCNYLALSQAEVDVLESWGLTTWTYSVLMNGASVLAVTSFFIIGGLILWRQGISRIGWFVSLALIVMPITMISDANNLGAIHRGWLILATFLSILGNAILLLFLYLFPTGRFYPHWTRIPLMATFLLNAILSLDLSSLISLPDWFNQPITLVLLILLFGAVGFQILRYQKNSTAIERQQTKWIILGLVILVLAFPIWILFFGGGLKIPPGQPRLLASLGGWLSLILTISTLPFTMSIAILRYRLWDIDLIIRRTLQYSLLSGLLALVYFGGIVVLQSVFTAVTGQSQSPLVVVLSTLAIAALFFPLRNRVQAFIDKRFFRQKYDAAKTLAAFAATARDETDLDKLTARLAEVVDETMQPESVAVWLRSTDINLNREMTSEDSK